MAKFSGDITGIFKRIDQGMRNGGVKALNKALSSTKTDVVKDLKDQTGIKAALINKRLRTLKATSTILQAKLQIATKVGINLSEFAPKVKVVKVAGKPKPGSKGRPKGKTYYGVTVKVGKLPRTLVPGGFLATVKNGKQLVLARKGTARTPTVALKTRVLLETAISRQEIYKVAMKDKFMSIAEETIGQSLDSAIDKLF